MIYCRCLWKPCGCSTPSVRPLSVTTCEDVAGPLPLLALVCSMASPPTLYSWCRIHERNPFCEDVAVKTVARVSVDCRWEVFFTPFFPLSPRGRQDWDQLTSQDRPPQAPSRGVLGRNRPPATVAGSGESSHHRNKEPTGETLPVATRSHLDLWPPLTTPQDPLRSLTPKSARGTQDEDVSEQRALDWCEALRVFAERPFSDCQRETSLQLSGRWDSFWEGILLCPLQRGLGHIDATLSTEDVLPWLFGRSGHWESLKELHSAGGGGLFR